MSDVLSVVSNLFKPVSEFIDDSSLSAEERRQFQKDINELQFGVLKMSTEANSRLAELDASVRIAEANSKNWWVSAWRPFLNVGMFILISTLMSLGIEVPLEAWATFGSLSGLHSYGRNNLKAMNNISDKIQYKK